MTSRSIYRFLLRLHPACFRKQYEDQMLWIFDESVRSRGAASLLADAAISLARQWVLRSGYRRHALPGLAVDGTLALSEQLRRNAQNLHRRAWRVNLFWMVAGFIVALTLPVRFLWSPFVLPILLNVIGTYYQNKRGRVVTGFMGGFGALSLRQDPRIYYRKHIEAKRDGLLNWSSFKFTKKSQPYGGGFLLMALAFLGAARLLLPLRPGVSFDGPMFEVFLLGWIALAVSWRFVKRMNKRAARAIQQEMDAMDDPAKPQSV